MIATATGFNFLEFSCQRRSDFASIYLRLPRLHLEKVWKKPERCSQRRIAAAEIDSASQSARYGRRHSSSMDRFSRARRHCDTLLPTRYCWDLSDDCGSASLK